MLIIFTGNGKGKTTAAIGQAMRAIGNGSRVLMVQFIKGPWKSGEDESTKKFDHFRIVKKGKGFVGTPCDKLPLSLHKEAAQEALAYAIKEIETKQWNILILDEIWVALSLKLLAEKEISDFLKASKDFCQHFILTGRNCPQSFVDRADLVTEMVEVKHPFAVGIPAVRSVEY